MQIVTLLFTITVHIKVDLSFCNYMNENFESAGEWTSTNIWSRCRRPAHRGESLDTRLSSPMRLGTGFFAIAEKEKNLPSVGLCVHTQFQTLCSDSVQETRNANSFWSGHTGGQLGKCWSLHANVEKQSPCQSIKNQTIQQLQSIKLKEKNKQKQQR